MPSGLARALRGRRGARVRVAGHIAVSVTGPTGFWTQRVLYSIPPAPGVLRAGAGAVPAELNITARCVWKPGALLHDSPERSESILCARDLGFLTRRMLQSGWSRKGVGVRARRFAAWAWLISCFHCECDQFCGDGLLFSQAEQKLVALARVVVPSDCPGACSKAA